MSSPSQSPHQMRLYDAAAQRLYLNAAERDRFVAACQHSSLRQASFGLTLLYTGCRISEALALTPSAIQAEAGLITFRTLKRRRQDCYREVPVPSALLEPLQQISRTRYADQPLWHRHGDALNRSSAYRWIKTLMKQADISGVHASPKGLRHGYGIHALNCGVPLNMLQKWMGHADMATTAIYANACGSEEMEIAGRMWSQ